MGSYINRSFSTISSYYFHSSGIDLDSTVIGRAFVGTMCNRRSSTGITQDGGMSFSRVVTTAAHELGHIFNMNHDDDGMSMNAVVRLS